MLFLFKEQVQTTNTRGASTEKITQRIARRKPGKKKGELVAALPTIRVHLITD
jgi:hypothetical protein